MVQINPYIPMAPHSYLTLSQNKHRHLVLFQRFANVTSCSTSRPKCSDLRESHANVCMVCPRSHACGR